MHKCVACVAQRVAWVLARSPLTYRTVLAYSLTLAVTAGETPVSRQARSAASTCAASVVVSGRTVASGSSASLSRVSASRRPLVRVRIRVRVRVS